MISLKFSQLFLRRTVLCYWHIAKYIYGHYIMSWKKEEEMNQCAEEEPFLLWAVWKCINIKYIAESSRTSVEADVAHLLVEIVEVAVAVLHGPSVLPIRHLDDVDLEPHAGITDRPKHQKKQRSNTSWGRWWHTVTMTAPSNKEKHSMQAADYMSKSKGQKGQVHFTGLKLIYWSYASRKKNNSFFIFKWLCVYWHLDSV